MCTPPLPDEANIGFFKERRRFEGDGLNYQIRAARSTPPLANG